jgi:tRNA threonylcarbamoyl adenosine modification protein YeaZ
VNPSNETWLCVDLSSPTGTVALFQKGALVREATMGPEFSHSERLIATVEELLKGVGLAGVDRFVTTSGPGSFTGLRIALASLKAFALATGKPIDTLSASEARALAWGKGPSIVVTYVTKDRFVRAEYPPGEELIVGAEALTGEKTFLVDERTPALQGVKSEIFPLRARHLGEALARATTRKTHATPAELIAATPHYFGETRYREVSSK